MKTKNLIAAALLTAALPATADITLTLGESAPVGTYTVAVTPLSGDTTLNVPEPAQLELTATERIKTVKNPAFPAMIIVTDPSGRGMEYTFSLGASDNIKADITPNEIVFSGTPLLDACNALDAKLNPILAEFDGVQAIYDKDPKAGEALASDIENRYKATVKEYVAANRGTNQMLAAMLKLEGQDLLDAYNVLTEAERALPLFPAVQAQEPKAKAAVEREAKLQAMQTGCVMAPAFTLPNPEGKMVSLSDFRGKWVILDFWGSWCRWCVKGFPELKEIYASRPSDLEIIGIDCRDTPDQWKAALKKYELPWVNLYNDCSGDNNELLRAYMVQGFPTKVIVGPDGCIKKIVVGADPRFPEILKELMSAK